MAMMRVPRKELNEAVASLLVACAKCTDTAGHKLFFCPTAEQAEAVVLGAMTTLAFPTGPVSPDDVFFISNLMDGTSWPPKLKE